MNNKVKKKVPMKKLQDKINKQPLVALLNSAEKEDLAKLILELAASDNSIKRRCLNALKNRVDIDNDLKRTAESSAALSLWYEVEFELSELDEYGGGDYGQEQEVGDKLCDLCDLLGNTILTKDDSEELLEDILRYIKSGNAGMDDLLYDVAYATCKNDNDLRYLAKHFEVLNGDWAMEHARRVYKRIGDSEKYLQLRALKMRYGNDYYDLATFYWENDEKDKAMDTAKKGMNVAEGRMDDLRMFLAERAKESGDRGTYLDYLFSQKTECLTLSSYKDFKKACSAKEWKIYEPQVVEKLEKNDDVGTLKILIYRKEFEKAIQCFRKICSDKSYYYFGSSDILSAASDLEDKYPKDILNFYKLLAGNLNVSVPRKEYKDKAMAVKRVQHLFVDVMKTPEDWRNYALPIKMQNIKRPAFQEEFARVISGWRELQ